MKGRKHGRGKKKKKYWVLPWALNQLGGQAGWVGWSPGTEGHIAPHRVKWHNLLNSSFPLDVSLHFKAWLPLLGERSAGLGAVRVVAAVQVVSTTTTGEATATTASAVTDVFVCSTGGFLAACPTTFPGRPLFDRAVQIVDRGARTHAREPTL